MVLVAVHVLICFVLIAVILLQAGRGQGLSGASFSGGGVQSLFGTRAADFLTKATTVSAILFLFTCIGLDIMEARKSRSLFEAGRPAAPVDVQQIQKVLEKIKAEQKNPETASPSPAAGTSGTKAPAAEPSGAGTPEKKKG